MSASGVAWYLRVSSRIAISGVNWSGILLITQSSFELFNKRPQRYAKFLANEPHLDKIDSPFTSLYLADARLFEWEVITQLLLCDSRSRARLDQKLKEGCVSGGVNAFLHATIMYSKIE